MNLPVIFHACLSKGLHSILRHLEHGLGAEGGHSEGVGPLLSKDMLLTLPSCLSVSVGRE